MIYVLAPAVLALAAMWVHHRASQSWFARSAWRWFSGQPLDGRPRTNATWLRAAGGDHPVLHPTGRAVGWHHRPRLLRAAIRTGATLALFGAGFGLGEYRAATLAALAALAGAVVVLLGWRVYRLTRQFSHHWWYHRPTLRALTRELSVPPPRLAIERDRSRAEVGLPAEFTGSDREREAITRVVTTKLALEAPDAAWSLSGKKPGVVFTKSVPPPASVTARDILAEVKAAKEHELVLGIGKKDQIVKRSIDVDTPHIGLCMGTGDGKSAAAMNLATQILFHGGLVLFLDYKLMSHMWARGLPNVSYAGTIEEIHQALIWLAYDDEEHESELTRRKKVALASADIRGNVTADIGPRILVVAEELNATQKRLKAYWRRLGGRGPSPAAEALDEIHFTGRQLRMHALDIAQRLSAKASGSDGSADSRENIGTIVFSSPSSSTWKMLTDGHVQPPASDHKGRYQVVTRKTVQEMQGALWDEEDARAFATSGTLAVPRLDMPFVTPSVPALVGVPLDRPALHGGSGQGFVIGQTPALPPSAVTLRHLVEAEMFPSIAAARKAAQRPGFPEAVGRQGASHDYDLEAMRAYLTAKQKAMR